MKKSCLVFTVFVILNFLPGTKQPLAESLSGKVQVATVTVVEQISLVREILAEVIAPQRQTISAETYGVVSSQRLEMGTKVIQGQVVVQLDSREAEAVVAIAVSELASAGVELAYQERSLQRARKNRDQKAISESLFDNVRTAFEKAEVQHQLAARRLTLQQTRLEKYSIRTPFSGELVRSTPVTGLYVRSGDRVFEVVNPSIRRIALQLTPDELTQLLRGDYGLICGGETMTVVSLSPVGESKTGMASVETLGCSSSLPGQHIGVKLVALNTPDIPEYGIFEDARGRFVYVVNHGKVGRREYTRLQTGERVIVIGADRVEIGDWVTSVDVDAET